LGLLEIILSIHLRILGWDDKEWLAENYRKHQKKLSEEKNHDFRFNLDRELYQLETQFKDKLKVDEMFRQGKQKKYR
jgi:hypothetical protein